MSKEHGLTLLEGEMIEIINIVRDLENQTEQNSHKHGVSGKRPMLTEIQIVQAMAAVDLARQKLESLLAACASGAVDTVAEEEVFHTCIYCGAWTSQPDDDCYAKPSAEAPAEGQP